MSISAFLLFAATEFFLSLSPGPAVFLVVSQGIRGGFRSSIAGSLGILTGNAIYFALSALGIGAVLVASTTLFLIIKWCGAAYLIFLGAQLLWQSLRQQDEAIADTQVETQRSMLFRQGVLMQLANPQAIMYFVAILPQFMDVHAAPLPQLLLLGFISIFIEFPILLVYGWLAEKGGSVMRRGRFAQWSDRVGGAFLIGAGVKLALTEQG